VHERDAYELWLAMLPTRTARGVVVVDPPYEQADD
jgi:23S rRNA (adenine2030-N6)-methyltransferase